MTFDGAASPPLSEARLVMYETENGPEGALFPVDADAYTRALFRFQLPWDQELPDIEPGAIVTVDGPLKVHASPTIRAGNVSIVPARGLRSARDSMRIFAERGNVIGPPARVGWNPDWRYLRSSSLDSVSEWEHRLKGYVKEARFYLAMLGVILVVLTINAFTGHRGVVYPFVAVSGGGVLVRARAARRAQRVLEQARSQPHTWQPMKMRLWWSAGHGHGPMAVASLFPLVATNPDVAEAKVHVPVIKVPVGYSPEPLRPVDVAGLPSGAVVIRDGDIELWPADRAYRKLNQVISRKTTRVREAGVLWDQR